MKNQKGFTLIEILVTMVIIGILTTAAAVSFEKARAKGRDTARKNDLLNISIALESRYAYEKNYPSNATGCNGNPTNYASTCNTISSPWIPGLASYLDPLPIERGPKVGGYTVENNPCPPNLDQRVYQYKISELKDHYHLLARLELNDSEATKNGTGNQTVDCGAAKQVIIPLTSLMASTFTTTITGYPIYALYK